ncbi:MAG: disulfide bond formation protein B, partial [Hyphomicrobiales bacterium]|nr:disulfide bond formation protein B [Hyphomicrobiales bacterium]
PCELCYKERWAWYAALPLGALIGLLGGPKLRRAGLALLVLILLANAGLGFYHFGVEQGWWAGPSGCTGLIGATNDVNAFLKSLNQTHVVRCDAPALKVLGLSLAAWNGLVSAGMALVAGLGAAKRA